VQSSSPPDKRILKLPDSAAYVIDDMLEAFRESGQGPAWDACLGMSPWGLDFGRIEVPVHLYHGRLDYQVPLCSSEFVASLVPEATLHTLEEQGHFGLFDPRTSASIMQSIQESWPSFRGGGTKAAKNTHHQRGPKKSTKRR
jgi:pimeloyl-ACP methyl ester carboxylesterase